jgi:hypothetical protein
MEYWSAGVLECWKTLDTPLFQYSNTPILQYSNTPILQYSNTPSTQVVEFYGQLLTRLQKKVKFHFHFF